MRTVVTGGAGFIGSNLVDALVERGDEVVVLDNFATGKREYVNPAATLMEHDIREPYEIDAEVVFHLAAQADVQTSMKRPDYDAEVNVVGTVNVLRASPGAQVIFSSSGGAGYGEGRVRELNLMVTDRLLPDRTFLVLLDPAEARRRGAGDPDRIEREGDRFWRRADDGFRALAAEFPGRIVPIDGAASPDTIAAEVREHVRALL